jgi:hypothetical protein
VKYPALAVEDVITQATALRQEFPQLAEDEELLADTLEGETDLHKLIDKLVAQVRENTAMGEAMAERIGMLRDRQTRVMTRSNFYRGLIHRLLEHTGVKAVPTVEGKVSVVSAPEKVIITDEAAIPKEFMRIKMEPDKSAIKTALKDGKHISGATLSNGGTTIAIR